MKAVKDIFQAEPDFYEFVNSPVLSKIKKKEAIENIFKGRISSEVLNFLYILIDKRRTRNFGKIVDQYQIIVDDTEGVSPGEIYSVEPLTEEQLLAFEEKTGKLLRKNVKLENKIDTSLLGGVKVLIEGKIIDASIKKRLSDIREAIN
jgi:ATP synthase F1 delta subunit